MAYHRFSRGRRWRVAHRRRRHVFGKRKERAIRAIAMGPVETKRYYQSSLTFVGDTANNDFGALYNIFQRVPKGMVQDSEHAVIANKFDARGVKIWIQSLNSTNDEYICRVTVLSLNDYYFTPSGTGTQILANNGGFYEQDVTMPQVRRRFNTQRVKVLASKQFSLKKMFPEQTAEESFHEMWVPIKGIKTSETEEPAGGTTVGELKGRNYYILVDHYLVGDVTPVDWASIVMNMAFCVYFKDP